MQAESLEVLEKASFAPAQARAIVRAIEIELVGAPETLATKNDLAVLGVDLRGKMTALRAEIAKQGGDLRAEVYGATRQMYMALLAQATVLLAFFCFTVTAPTTAGQMSGGRVLSVELGPDEDVEWIWSHDRERGSHVTGYKIVARVADRPSRA